MNAIISRLTQTGSLLINLPVAVALTLIATCLIALVANMIINPQDVANASYGIYN